MSRRVIILLIAVALVVGGTSRSQGSDQVAIDITPDTVAVSAGDVVTALARLTNPTLRPMVVEMTAVTPAGVNVSFAPATVQILPGASREVNLTASLATDASGTLVVQLRATETTPPAPPVVAAWTLLVQPPPALRSEPDAVTLQMGPHESAVVDLRITNPANATANVTATPPNAQGWTFTFEPAAFLLSPGASRVVRVTVTAGAQADGAIVAVDHHASGFVTATTRFTLEFVAPSPPPAQTPNATTDPADVPNTSANATGEGPSGDGTSPPPNGTDDPPPPPPSEDPSPSPPPETPEAPTDNLDREETTPTPAQPVLRFDPQDASMAPASRANVSLLVTNPGAVELEVQVVLVPADGAWLDPAFVSLTLVPGETRRVALTVETATNALPGSTNRLQAFHGDAAAEIRIHIEAEPSGADLLTLRAQASAPLPWLALALALLGAGTVALAASRKRWVPVLAALYARIASADVRLHPMRDAIARLATERPGITLSDLQRHLGLANGALVHHVRTLERARVVVLVPDGQHRRVYLQGAPRAPSVAPARERILRHLETQGPTNAADLARALGMSKQALHYHVKRLVSQGEVAPDASGRLTVSSPP